MKLIVTGHAGSGGEAKSVFTQAGPPGNELHPGAYLLWATRGALAVPDATAPDALPDVPYFPGPGETSLKIVSVPPPSAGTGTAGEVAADLAGFFDADDPAMHTTDTIDYVFILGGSADLELDDGAVESVAVGDVVVQRGTRHAWRVTSDEPLVLGAVLLGAERTNAG